MSDAEGRGLSTAQVTGYALLSVVAGTLFAALVLALLVVSLALLVVGIGVVLLPVWGWLTDRLAAVERGRARALLGAATPPASAPERPAGGWVGRGLAPLRSARLWRETGFLVGQLLAGPLALALTVLAWAAPLSLLGGAGWWRWSGRRRVGSFVVGSWPVVIGAGCAGLLLLVAAPAVVRLVGRAQRRWVECALGPDPRARLRERIAELERTRRIAVAAAEAERRRLERDLHDGAQARIVALAVELGLAAEILTEVREAHGGARAGEAADLVEGARRHALTVVEELRELAHGLHPSVLSARGLHAALSALTAAAPVPVTVDVDDSIESLPVELEAVVYYATAEALANVFKHARATTANVRVCRRRHLLTVAVADDGCGGATVRPGGGLAGITQRLAPVDGRLEVASPPGYGTRIEITIPVPAAEERLR